MSSSSSGQGSRRAACDLDAPSPAAAPKRQKMDSGLGGRGPPLSYDDYTVGWVSALPLEMAAARAMLDEEHQLLPAKRGDNNTYTLGRIGGHNVVMACLSRYGTAAAAAVAGNMRRSFPQVQIGLLVGIGGGAPGCGAYPGPDIRLGDVVVGDLVVQYDLGRTVTGGRFQRTSRSGRPPDSLATAVANLRGRHKMEPSRVPQILADMLQRHPYMAARSRYTRPTAAPDRLFDAGYDHCGSATACYGCDTSRMLSRPARCDENPRIHYGTIASGNQVIKDGATRDRQARELGAVCFEMEAAGLIDASFPCLVVRGISDYADSHKNKQWQGYAAAAAAAYAKELLAIIPADTSQQALPDAAMSLHHRRSHLLDSLMFDEMESRQLAIKAAYSNTCRWLLDHTDYSCWLNPDEYARHHGFLWINGKPGAGKSTLMKYVYEHEKRQQTGAAATLSFFFNARGAELEKSTQGMYRSLLVQLLSKLPDLQQVLDGPDLCPQTQNDSNWDIESLHSLFTRAVMKLGDRRLTCFVDALDECDDFQVRDMVTSFEDLGDSAAEAGTRLYFCFSSRHYPHITVRCGLRLTLEDQHGHQQDLDKYVRKKLTAGSGKKVNEVRDKILRKSGGVFMWVVLVVDILNKEFRNGRLFAVKKRLEDIPEKLSELFRDILRRDSENMDDLRLCIQWILYSKRPLRRDEFYFALVSGLDPDPENLTELDPEDPTVEDMNRFVLSSSKGLAEITKAAKNQTVQFIHGSVRDFLVKDDGLRELWPELGAEFESLSHERLRQCCHTYLVNTSDLTGHDEEPAESSQRAEDLSKKLPFLAYATRHVLDHADAAAAAATLPQDPQDKFLQEFHLGAWIKQRNLVEKYKVRRYTQNVTLLYILAEMNLARLIRMVRRLDPRIDFPGERHQYPLFAALANGHRDAVRALLCPPTEELPRNDEVVRNLQFGQAFKSRKGQTPLMWAAEKGHTAVVKLLLETPGVEPGRKDRQGQTPLLYAAEKGHADIVKLLLATPRVYPDISDRKNRTPLLCAAQGGHEETAGLLLDTEGVDCNARDNQHMTHAHVAQRGATAIVGRLLATPGIDPDTHDQHAKTPLLHAVKRGHEEVVRLLLDTKRVDCNARDGERKTPLSCAAEYGNTAIVKLLLATPGIDIYPRDRWEQTPLFYAATSGHESIVKLILTMTDSINSEIRNRVCQGLIRSAAIWGQDATLRPLLSIPGINPNAKDSDGDTPLLCAAKLGHEAIVKLLLETPGIDPNARGSYGESPLKCAADSGHETILKLLIATPGIDLNVEDMFGKSSLHSAARWGHEAVVGLLLATGGVNPNAEDKNGQTAMEIALQWGHMGIVMKLLKIESVFRKEKERSGWIPREATQEAFLRQLRSEHVLTHSPGEEGGDADGEQASTLGGMENNDVGDVDGVL